jgi:hypothetical protein
MIIREHKKLLSTYDDFTHAKHFYGIEIINLGFINEM